jgi:catechol 2,3-dioxygenase-like lactoylglutathione lyase family enzyme
VTRLNGSSAVLLVSDIDRAIEFWRDRLGFALSRDASAIVPS